MSDFMMFSDIIKLKQADMCGPPNQKKKIHKSSSKLKPMRHLLSIFEDHCRTMTLDKAKGFAFKSSAPLGLGPKQMFVQDQIAFAFWADLHLGPGHGVPD